MMFLYIFKKKEKVTSFSGTLLYISVLHFFVVKTLQKPKEPQEPQEPQERQEPDGQSLFVLNRVYLYHPPLDVGEI